MRRGASVAPQSRAACRRDHVYGEYLAASATSVKKTVAKAPVLSAVKPWKDVEGVKLAMSHKDMLNIEQAWLDDRVMDAYVASWVRNSNVHCRYDVPVGWFVGAGGNVPGHLNQVRNGGNVDCEVQVLNVNNSHWILAVRFPQEAGNAAFVYDSLGHAPTEEVKAQVRRCFGMQRAASVTQLVGPRQPSGHECGPFVCAAVERLVVDQPTTIGAARPVLARANFNNVTIRGNILQALDSWEARRQLEEYFAGERGSFELPLEPLGTPFHQTVWNVPTKQWLLEHEQRLRGGSSRVGQTLLPL
jgi:hypothetical protein